jgi:2-polyprenyl-3-methyl-5-hydroxy-6-metoxy-1,4-benzoquinol methylase
MLDKVRYWNSFWANSENHLKYNLFVYDTISRIVNDRSSILDVGCGNGKLYSALSGMKRDVYYTGFDFSNIALSRFLKDNPNFWGALRIIDLLEVPLMPRYKNVACINVLEYIEDIRESVFGLSRLLEKDGLLFLGWESVPGENTAVSNDGCIKICWGQEEATKSLLRKFDFIDKIIYGDCGLWILKKK